MSTPSYSSHLVAPDEPVKAYSELLESAFECLHRDICTHLSDPESINSAAMFHKRSWTGYYEIRSLLEQDFGISVKVARTLLVPDTTMFVSRANHLAGSEEGKRIFNECWGRGADVLGRWGLMAWKFSAPHRFWAEMASTVYEMTRCLRLVRRRISHDVTEGYKESYRFPWLMDVSIEFEDPSVTLDYLFFPVPERWGLRGDPVLWLEMASLAAAMEFPSNSLAAKRTLEGLFHELTGKDISLLDDIYRERFDRGGMSSGWISAEWWRLHGIPLLLERFERAVSSF